MLHSSVLCSNYRFQAAPHLQLIGIWNAIYNQYTMKNSMKNLLVGILILFGSVLSAQQECVEFYFEETIQGANRIVELKVNNFTDIVSIQLAIAYSTKNLELLTVAGNPDIQLDESNFNIQDPGYLVISWNNSVTPQSVGDTRTIVRMEFQVLDLNPSIVLIDENYDNEVVDETIEEICFTTSEIIINELRGQILGQLLHDIDGNCTASQEDIPLSGWKMRISTDDATYIRTTNKSGHYLIPVDVGNYTIEAVPINELWTPCILSKTIIVDTPGKNYDVSFVVSPTEDAPALEVSITANRLISCVDNGYQVYYKNNGTVTATNASIKIEFDEDLDYISNNFVSFSFSDQTGTANIGDLAAGAEGKFTVLMNVNCDNTEIGQTLSASAEITSDNTVDPPVSWGGAILSTAINCDMDTVEVIISNIGNTGVTESLNFIVVEDDVMFDTDEVDLGPLEDLVLRIPDDGGVYRVIVDQEAGFPNGSFATSFRESCDGNKSETYQYVSMFPNEEDNIRKDIESLEIVSSYAPNEKAAYPVGYREDHNINANQDLEYTIRFQNVGTDTVYNIYIEDLIDPALDLATLKPGPSSHNYTMSIIDERNVRFDFYNILLPDSTSQFDRSQGFVSYKISQVEDLPNGTMIGNNADIFFDYESQISTNVVDHLIGENFIEILLDNSNILLDDELMTAPNPASDMMRIEVPEEYEDVSYIIYNANGSVVNAANTTSNVFYINKMTINNGLYILEIKSKSRTIGTKKIIFKN